MSQYNEPSNIQYARFQILPVDLHFELFWSVGIPTILVAITMDEALEYIRLETPDMVQGSFDSYGYTHIHVHVCTHENVVCRLVANMAVSEKSDLHRQHTDTHQDATWWKEPFIIGYYIKATFSVRCMTFHIKSHTMKVLVILSHL